MAIAGGYEPKFTQYNTAVIQVTTTFNGSGIRALSGSSKIKTLKPEHFIGIHSYLERLSMSGIYYPDVIEPQGWYINDKEEWYLADVANCTKNFHAAEWQMPYLKFNDKFFKEVTAFKTTF
jgi:hypothetical protein